MFVMELGRKKKNCRIYLSHTLIIEFMLIEHTLFLWPVCFISVNAVVGLEMAIATDEGPFVGSNN